jgi:hypothetical protein
MTPSCLQLRPAFAALALSLVSCSESGPPPIRTGTPAYYFQNAKDTYAKGDYLKAIDWLDKITNANKNDFTDRAWTFKLLLQSGLITGYKELAENYEYGQRSSKDNPTPFIKKVTEYRSAGSRMGLPFGEAYAAYEKNGPPAETVIDFPFPPAGSTTKPGQIGKIAQGLVPNEDSVAAAQKGMLARGIILAICRTVGAKEDAAKGRAALQTLPAKVPRSAFELEMANALYSAALLHSRKLQGNPAVAEFLSQQALKALAAANDTSKETKELKTNLEKELKEAKQRK